MFVEIVHLTIDSLDSTLEIQIAHKRKKVYWIQRIQCRRVAITTNSKDVDVIAVCCLKTLNALLHYTHVELLNCIRVMITHFSLVVVWQTQLLLIRRITSCSLNWRVYNFYLSCFWCTTHKHKKWTKWIKWDYICWMELRNTNYSVCSYLLLRCRDCKSFDFFWYSFRSFLLTLS